jgi:YD repeat-containing protein
VADFNNDGLPDLAVANDFDSTVTLLLNNSNNKGSFITSGTVNVAGAPDGTIDLDSYNYYGPQEIVIGDFNQDGVPDVAALNAEVYASPTSTSRVATLQTQLSVNSTSPVVITPPVGGGTHYVQAVYNGDGSYSASSSTTIPLTAPWISGIMPSIGLPGTFVRITGSNFGSYVSGTSLVTFNSVSAQIINWTTTAIEVIAPSPSSGTPSGVTTGPVIVTTANPTEASNGVIFTVPTGPTITGLSPVFGPVGSNVTISGFNFPTSSTAGTVSFNSVPASPTTWGSEAIIVPVPASATTGPVTVTVGSATSNSYNYTVSASINGIAPSQGNVGTKVIISGTGFGPAQGSSTVTFNGVSAIPSNWSNTSIVVPVPNSATTGIVAVTVNSLTAAGPEFEVTSASSGQPIISSLSPAQGPVGMLVTISGSNFGSSVGLSNVGFGSVPGVPVQWSQNRIVVPVPPGAVTGPVMVVVNSQASNSAQFTVGPAVASIAGIVTNATNGTPLSGALVQVLQSNAPVGSATSDVNGAYAISGLPAGTYDLLASAAGFGTSVIPGVSVTSSGTASVNVPLGPPGTISGTVTQSGGVTPIVGANVTVSEGNDTVATGTTNSTGAYSIPNLGAATYALQASAIGYRAGNQMGVSVSAGQTTTANLSLSVQSTIAYTYDELGRLVGVVDPVNGTAAYSYDAVGNITSITRTNAGQVSVLDFTPKSGPVGTTVMVSGTAFSSNAQLDSVAFAGTSATVSSASSSQLAVTVPTGAVTGPIAVTAPGGKATSTASFTVTAPTAGLSISSFTPTLANVGATVTIAGTGFDVLANDRVTFNGVRTSVTSATSTSISVTVPTNATSGPIAVAIPAGNATSSTDFFVVPTTYTPSQVDFTAQISTGGSYTGTIVNGGDIGLVLFNGILGQEFNLQVSGSTVTSGTISILNPNGSLLAQSAIGAGSSLLSGLVAPATGTYTILYLLLPQGQLRQLQPIRLGRACCIRSTAPQGSLPVCS